MTVADRLERARRAQADWSRRSPRARVQLLSRLRARVMEGVHSLTGPLARARGVTEAEALVTEVIPFLDGLRFLKIAGPRTLRPRRLGRSGRPAWLWGGVVTMRRLPHGMVLVIGPSNYPLFLAAAPAFQALAAGNAAMIKPGPGGGEALENLVGMAQECGLPADLLAVTDESESAGREAVAAGVDLVCFTGSRSVGASLLEQLAPQMTPAIMELSGCDAMVVEGDADLDLAARALVYGLSLNRGRTCIAPRRVLVHASIWDAFVERLASVAPASAGFDFVATGELKHAVQEALERATTVIHGGVSADDNGPWRGPVFLGPVDPASPMARMEWFAGLAIMMPFSSTETALGIANDHPFQLGATVFTRSHALWKTYVGSLRCGAVLWNDMVAPTADPRAAFGGRASSGFGVTRGTLGLEAMTTPQFCYGRAKGVRQRTRPVRSEDFRMFAAFAHLTHGGGALAAWRAWRSDSSKRL